MDLDRVTSIARENSTLILLYVVVIVVVVVFWGGGETSEDLPYVFANDLTRTQQKESRTRCYVTLIINHDHIHAY